MESDPLLSQTIGNYQILGRLGRGGMSTVYRARQITMQRDVALKVISAELAEDPQFVARFEREAQVIANLEHPRILPVHDYGHQGDYFYMAMRLVDGDSLHERLLRGPLSLAESAPLVEQIASALDYAHSRGVIHRDLKPQNILIDQLGNVYLMDFGIAKLMAASQQLTATGMVMGTPAYMAPEQWRGEAVDVRTDVYALGVILYEMILGTQPFEAADTPFTLMYKHLNDAPPAPRDLLPELPAAVEQVILRALAKKPEDRFQSAGALAAAYLAAIEDAGILAEAAPVVQTESGPAPALKPEAPIEAAAEAKLATPPERPLDRSGAPPHADESVPALAELGPVPPPAFIGPPPPPGVPPIPVPARVGRRSGDGTPPGTPRTPDLPEDVPPAVRSTIDWVAEKVQHMTIPGFIAPAEEEAVPPPPPPETGAWPGAEPLPAHGHVAAILDDDEPLVGALYVRGTADWRNWRRLIILGLIFSILGGIFGRVFNLWLFNVVGSLCWLYVLIQGIRTWRGRIGHYYVGFTPQSVVILPMTQEGKPQPEDGESADWATITRLTLTGDYLWVEASGSDAVAFLGWIPAHGWGGLQRQRKGLLSGPIAQLIRSKGFRIR